MSQNMMGKDLSLKGLELFQVAARQGSLKAVALETGLSISTISHHLKALESQLGVDLFNHGRRPMTLTRKGEVFLRNIEDALLSLRKARAEAAAGDIAEASHLRLGAIEDFDSDIVPELAVYLSGEMPSCDFTYHTDTSHQIIEMLRNRQLDLGITGSPPERLRDLQDRPLLRDPFVVVLARDADYSAEDALGGQTSVPFLRFTANLIIARQIEGQLKRMGVSHGRQFSCGNNQTLMAMVAAGAGWTITTPLLYSRARRFHDRLAMHPFPGRSFARTLSVVSTSDCSQSVLDLVDRRMRHLIADHATEPLIAAQPWLADGFRLID